MEFLSQIESYLAGNLSFTDAVALYAKIGTNKALKFTLSLGEDDYARKKLKDEFEAIIASLQANKKENEFKSFTPSKKALTINVELLPAHLRLEFVKLGPIIREMASLHAKLLLYPNDQERFTAAATIMQLSKERRAILNRIDYFSQHGTDHPMYEVAAAPKIIIPLSTVSYFEAQHKIKLLMSRRTKLKDQPNRYQYYLAVCKDIEFYRSIKKDD